MKRPRGHGAPFGAYRLLKLVVSNLSAALPTHMPLIVSHPLHTHCHYCYATDRFSPIAINAMTRKGSDERCIADDARERWALAENPRGSERKKAFHW